MVRRACLYVSIGMPHGGVLSNVDFEDTIKDDLFCGFLGFSADGNSIFLNSSIGVNTRSLMRLDIKTGKRTLLATDQTYDLDWVMFNYDTHTPELLSWQKARIEYKVLDSALKNDFFHIQSLSKGDLTYLQRSADAQKWIVGFSHDNKSYEYYYYDRAAKQSEFLFCTRPELNAYALASMKPLSFTSRDGLKMHGPINLPS